MRRSGRTADGLALGGPVVGSEAQATAAVRTALEAHEARIGAALVRCSRDIADSSLRLAAELEAAKRLIPPPTIQPPAAPPLEVPAAQPVPQSRPLPRWIRTRELVTEVLGVSRGTLWRWRTDPAFGFPRPLRVGGTVFYDTAEVLAWLGRHKT
jgi:predicted DNA-binding transcriptional regulator AlpA